MFVLCPLYNTFLGFSPIIVLVYLVWEGILIDNLIDCCTFLSQYMQFLLTLDDGTQALERENIHVF